LSIAFPEHRALFGRLEINTTRTFSRESFVPNERVSLKMGRPRTPIAQLKLQSNSSNLHRALRRGPQQPAGKKVKAGTPTAPAHLTIEERAVWDRVIRALSARGALTEGDSFIIEKYSTVYVRWQAERRALAEEGSVIEVVTKLGRDHCGERVARPNPRLKIVQSLERQLLQLDIELTLTPRHRGKQVESPKPELTLQELLAPLSRRSA
jgi:P27 family predicted phage terminase small subunit